MSRAEDGILKILSLSSVYPNPNEPAHGIFVSARLQSLGAIAKVKVIAPIPLLDYSNPQGKRLGRRTFSMHGKDRRLDVIYPRWAYPPFGTPVNVICLFLRLLGPMIRLRREFPFQVIDAHFGFPDGVTAPLLAAVFRCPFTITLRGSEPPHARNRLRRLCMQWAFRRAGRVFANSPNLREFALSLGAEPSRTKTIPNGIDTDTFHARDRAASRLKHGIDPHVKVILSAGELIEAKGHHRVMRAMKRLQDQGIRVQLVLAGAAGRGGPNYEPALRRLSVELNCEKSVHFMGRVGHENLAELMSAADVFCLASDTEGWPNVVHEALSCGTPVVATPVGGIPDMVSSSVYGFLTPLGDQHALENALGNALEKPWDRAAISQWGRSRSWDCVAREVLAEVQRLLAERELESEAVPLSPSASYGPKKIGEV